MAAWRNTDRKAGKAWTPLVRRAQVLACQQSRESALVAAAAAAESLQSFPTLCIIINFKAVAKYVLTTFSGN